MLNGGCDASQVVHSLRTWRRRLCYWTCLFEVTCRPRAILIYISYILIILTNG
jgi:hypothetical protein